MRGRAARRRLLGAALLAAPLLALPGVARAGRTLDGVRQAGELACGVVVEAADYTKDDTHGAVTRFALDLCRAVATAALGDAERVRAVAFPDEALALDAAREGRVTLVAAATPRLAAGVLAGVAFGPTVLYDGQGVLVATKGAGIASLADLAGRQVCFIADTPAGNTLDATLRARGIAYIPFPFEEMGEMEAALVSGRCAAMTGDVTLLAGARAEFHALTRDYVILPETLTLDPLAPATTAGDADWAALVAWVVSVLVQAEASGVGAAEAEALRGTDPRDAERRLGTDTALSRRLGLADDWALRVVASVGNYGEMFERDLGEGSDYHLPRGLNALWTRGGLMHPLPVR